MGAAARERRAAPRAIGVSGRSDSLRYHLSTDPKARSAPLTPEALALLGELGAARIVIRDYDLLDQAAVLQLAAPPRTLALLDPDHLVPEADAEKISAAAVMRPPVFRTLRPGDRERLSAYLAERRSATRQLSSTRSRILEVVAAASPEYAALLTRDDVPERAAMSVLRHYPTLRLLLADGPYALSHRLSGGDRLSSQLLIEEILKLTAAETAPSPEQRSHVEFAEMIVPELIAEYDITHQRVDALDAAMYGIVAESDPTAPSAARSVRDAQRASRTNSLDGDPHLLDVGGPVLPDLASGVEELSIHGLFELARTAFERRYAVPGDARTGYRDYLVIRERIDRHDDRLLPARRALLDLWGQILAVDNRDFNAEGRYAAAVAAAEEWADPETAASDVYSSWSHRTVQAESAIAHAIATALGFDSGAAFAKLRAATASGSAASPRSVLEGQGVIAMILATRGEGGAARDLLGHLDRTAEGRSEYRGVVRAAADVARMLTCGSVREDDALIAARTAAQEHSAGTPFEPHFHYLVMHFSYLTGRIEEGLAAYDRLRRVDRPLVAPRLGHMTELTRAVLLGGMGSFAEARAVVRNLRKRGRQQIDSAQEILQSLILARLDIASGDYSRILAATDHGELSEQRAAAARARYLPAVLVLRGSAFAELGKTGTAAALFERALAKAVEQREFLSLVSIETRHFRAWLEQAVADGVLPPGVPESAARAILSRPPFIDRELPALTRQQSRVLFLLSSGKTVSAIATELSISGNTLKTHLRLLYQKLDVSSREQAVVVAAEYGLLASGAAFAVGTGGAPGAGA